MTNNFKEFILKNDELIVLLNILYLNGNSNFNVYPYLIKEKIFSVALEDQVIIKRLINKNTYNQSLPEKSFPEIIPQYSHLRNILIASGFLKMSNWDTMEAELNRIKSIDPLQGQRFTFIGMDTNSYINRIYSVLKNSYKGNISNYFFVLSRVIEIELRAARNIPNEQLDELKADENYKDNLFFLDEFWNGESISTRIKHIGRVEFNKLRKQSRCLINNSIELNGDIESDLQIIEDFRGQIIKQNYDLLLLSSDKHFEQARESGIYSLNLKIPNVDDIPDQFSGNWQHLCDFIYLNSIYFGAISFRGPNNTIQIYGLWRGKSTEDWDSESVKIRIGSKTIIDLLEQQLKII
ncbi:hypothetical protein LCGC14_0887380 [marine sediment metagenome]|uniref:PIN domain-containing protein n=1 Tax=marine sediment metagenome TaxID=412755 RepID=A0A0F9S747_9ZZZZ|nr:hypothetical protein [bacterium]